MTLLGPDLHPSIDSPRQPQRLSPRAQRALVNTAVDPEADDHVIVRQVTELFRTARTLRAPILATWKKCYDSLRGGRPVSMYNLPPGIQLPEIWPVVRSSVGWKLDQRITSRVRPASAIGTEWHTWLSERCQDMELVLESTAHAHHEEVQIQLALWDSDTYGTGILKTNWDPNLCDGKGDAVLTRLNPYAFYPDPAATNEYDGDFYSEVRLMSPLELDRRYPGKLDWFLDGNVEHEAFDEPPSQLGRHPSTHSRPQVHPLPQSTIPPWMGNNGSGNQSRDNRITGQPIPVIEMWVREHKRSTTKVSDRWRCIVIGGGKVLMNKPAKEIFPHGRHPYTRVVPHDLGEFWGIGLVELLGPAQGAFNRILRSLQHNIELTGNPVLREDAGAGTQSMGLNAARPGSRITPRNPNSQVEWVQPPGVHPNITEILSFLLERMKSISGLNDVTSGQLQGRPAAETAGMLQEAQFISIRSQLINLEHSLSAAYRMKAALITSFYTQERVLDIVGPDGEATTKFLGPRHFMRPGPGGSTPLEYSVRVEAGSQAHTSRKVRHDQAITLFTLGAIDVMTLLEAMDFPNPSLVLKRLGLQQQSILSVDAPNQKEAARA